MFLGVDGGGTKTALCLIDDRGEVVARASTGSVYAPDGDLTAARAVLAAGVGEVCAAAGISPGDLAYAFFALPAYGETRSLQAALDALPADVLGHTRYTCDNDMVAAWAGSLGTADGINVIAGTGSMAYGRHLDRAARVGGWGELFGDEGSGHWIGLQALTAFTLMSDGRRPRGPLHALIRQELGLDDDFEVIDVVMNRWAGARSRVAALSRTLAAAAEQGDAAARGILDQAAGHLVDLARTVLLHLRGPEGPPLPVSWSGGIFSVERVRAGFVEGCGRAGLEPRAPLEPPDLGAARYAARLARSQGGQRRPTKANSW